MEDEDAGGDEGEGVEGAGVSPSVGWSSISLAIRMGIKMLRVLGFLYSIYEDGKDVMGEVLE